VGDNHIYFDETQSKSLGEALKFNAIPFYILIDKNGQIVDTGNGQLRPGRYFTERKVNALLE